MSTVDRLLILHGPGVPGHVPSLERWCAEASGADGRRTVALERHATGAALAAALADAAANSGTAVVLVPGEATESVVDLAARAPRGQLIWMEVERISGPPDARLAAARVQTVRGRGTWGYPWAVGSLAAQAAWPSQAIAYGEGRDHAADLRLPDGDGPWPVMVLIHGGAWGQTWERDLMDAMAVDLARRGYATWNIEYRRLGEGGGWPETFLDVAAAIDHLVELDAPLDLARVGIAGHSAGGHLALWASGRHRLPTEAPGSAPRVRPAFVLSLAGLPDMEDAATRGVYDRGAERVVGGLPSDPVAGPRFAWASPRRLLPLGVPQLLIHGLTDLPDNVDMNRIHLGVARASGDQAELVELPGVGHFEIIDPRSAVWPAIAEALEYAFPPGA